MKTSVIICTYNPRRHYLERTLAAIVSSMTVQAEVGVDGVRIHPECAGLSQARTHRRRRNVS